MSQHSKKININDERKVRIAKLEDIEKMGIDPYPAKVNRKHTVDMAMKQDHGQTVEIAGRLVSKRDMGKLTFASLQDESARVQIVFKKDVVGDDSLKLFAKKIDIGDIISLQGERFKTQKGEESVLVRKWTLLAKSLLPIPDEFYGLDNEEARYRKRYLDFLMNKEQKEKIEVRGKVLRYFRDFLMDKGFVEVETPILEIVASGAAAEPFKTYLNAYGMDMYLRICIGELWQKRLIVGGFEKVFEIGRAFRNEGVSFQHNPEFTMLEYYWAFADFNDNMKFHEVMIPFVIKKSIGSLKVRHGDDKLDFKAPYKKITFHDAVRNHSGIDIDKYSSVADLRKVMKSKKLKVDAKAGRGKLLDMLYKQTTRPEIIQPTFVTHYPIELKPLAKKAKDPRYTEMFQLLVKGQEISNSYTELNDPVDQRERFQQQENLAKAGDPEAMGVDSDYVEAMEHGMPPTTGTGIGIDRFVALITGSHTVREVTAFPLMKPSDKERKKT
jgi:lysyl-tRNA synthetase, class II